MNERWKTLLTSVLTPSAVIAGIALMVIWGYFSRLDRLDIFSEVVTVKSVLGLIFAAALFTLILLLLIFFVISLLTALVIPQDVENLTCYEKIKSNLILAMLISGFLPMVFIYVFYYALDISATLKEYSAWISMASIGLVTMLLSYLMNRKSLEHDLSFKTPDARRKSRLKFYIAIPLLIALIAHIQVFPLEIVYSNISVADEKVSFWPVAGIALMSYMIFFLTLLPGLVYLRIQTQDNILKKMIFSISVALMVLCMISTRITVIPVIFMHGVMKFSGISDFRPHTYLIKETEYPEQLFSNEKWERKTIKPEQYYSVQAVSLFMTNQFHFLCPKEISGIYRASWKFNPWDADFDTSSRKQLQLAASYCVAVSASAVKRWDIPLKSK